MKSLFRLALTVLVLIAVMAAFPAISTHAQSADKPCFDLQAADCTLLYGAFTPESGAQYAKGVTIAYSLDVKVGGTTPASVSVTGTGVAGGTSAEDALFSTDLNLTSDSNNQKMTLPLQVRVVNKKLYFNSAMFTQGKWQFLALDKATSAGGSGASLQDQLKSLGAMMGGSATGGNTAAMSAASDPEVQAAIVKAFMSPGVVTSAVTDAKATDGTAVKQIVFTFSAVKMIQSPELRPALEKMVAASPEMGTDADAVSAKLSDALKDTTLVFGVQIGSDDKLLHGLALHVASKIPQATLKELSKDSSSVTGDLDFDMTLKFDLSKIGTAPTVEEPTDAKEFDMSAMFGGMGGGLGSGSSGSGSSDAGSGDLGTTAP